MLCLITPSNESMKPTAPLRSSFIVFASTPCHGLSLSRQAMKRIKRYMVIEHFKPGTKAKIYERFHQKGRMLPKGLIYVDSWLEKGGHRCFQLMETRDRSLFEAWVDC